MCRGFVIILIIAYNSTATHQVPDCHHQLLLFVLIMFITLQICVQIC